jgi:hypothetical protein
MPKHREKCSNRYSGGSRCRHGTLRPRPYGPAGRRLDRRPLGLDTTDGLFPDALRITQDCAVEGYLFTTASVGASDRNFVTVAPTVADLRTEMRNLNATLVSQLSVKSGLTSGRRDNVSTGSHRPRG